MFDGGADGSGCSSWIVRRPAWCRSLLTTLCCRFHHSMPRLRGCWIVFSTFSRRITGKAGNPAVWTAGADWCSNSDPTLITATLNNLAQIIKSRPPLAPKVIGAVIAFNPFVKLPRAVTIHDKLMVLSVEKTTRVLLMNIMRYDSLHSSTSPVRSLICLPTSGTTRKPHLLAGYPSTSIGCHRARPN